MTRETASDKYESVSKEYAILAGNESWDTRYFRKKRLGRCNPRGKPYGGRRGRLPRRIAPFA